MKLNVRSVRSNEDTIVGFEVGDGSMGAVTNGGSHVPLPDMWVRDNCICDECRIAQTGEHRYFVGTADTLPAATDRRIVDNKLVVDWSDGHTTTLAPTDLNRLLGIARRDHRPATLWDASFTPERFDHDRIAGDPDHRLAFLRSLIAHGCAIVSDAPTESGTCIRFLENLGVPIRDTPFDRLHDVFFHADGYNVAHTDEPLPPHTDFASYQWPPSGQILHMLVNEVDGGESILVDGWKVLSDLQTSRPDVVDVLSRVLVGFREHSDTAESWTRAPIVRRTPNGEIAGIRFSNQLMQPLDPTEPEIEAFYEAYHVLSRALADPVNQTVFRTNGGEMQIVHSHRVLHARRGFDGTAGTRHLQDTYFEFDDLAAMTALISGELPGGH